MHGMIFLMMLLGLAAMVFWIWTLIDCLTNKQLTETQKVVWTVVIIFAGWLGSLIYLFAGRAPRVYAPAQQYYSSPQTYRQSQAEAFLQENYQSYQEGYRAQSYARPQYAAPSVPVAGEEQSVQQAQYEEIQISYPEQPAND